MLTIGLDIGTTGLCALLLDSDSGEVVKMLNRPNSFFIDTPKSFERIQDAGKICDTVKEMLDELFVPGVGTIGVTGQMHGIVYLDKNGNLLSPLYTWQDARGELEYDGISYSGRFGAPSGYGLTTDFYNEVNSLVPIGTSVLCTVHDLMAMRLAGCKTPLMHASDAASLGQYDCVKGEFKIKNPRLPQVTKNICQIGEYKGASVFTAIGDNQASFFGASDGKAALINVGTGSQISIPVDGYREVPGLETRPLDGDRYILVGSSLCGGRAFALLERFFSSVAVMAGGTQEPLYKKIDAILEKDYITDLIINTQFCGTRAEPSLRASVENLSDINFTAQDFAAAVVDGIARELYGFYKKSGEDICLLSGSGNGIRKNAALIRAVERQFGCTLLIPTHREEAAFGAALLGSVCQYG